MSKLIKYRTRNIVWRSFIDEVEIDRETNNQVIRVLTNSRGESFDICEDKVSKYEQYHDTWEDAKAYLQAKAEEDAELAKAKLQKAEAYLERIEALRKE